MSTHQSKPKRVATRFSYALPIAQQLLASVARRRRSGGLPAAFAYASPGKPLVIVTGTGRSGSSAVARVLHESGVRMGSDFDRPTEANVEGFYEERGVYWLHEQMLTELGLTGFWRTRKWPWRSTVLAVAARYREQMEALVGNATDGWKDPLFCIMLEAWLPLLSARPKLVVCLRSPQAYADSVTRVFGLVKRETAEDHWARSYRRLLDVIRDYELEATCVEYDALIEHPEKTVAGLSEFVGCQLDPKYVDPPLRHFAHTVPEKYARLYQEVGALSSLGALKPVQAGDEGHPIPRDVSRPGAALPSDGELSIDEYLQRVSDVALQTEASKAIWSLQLELPRAKLAHFAQLGLSLSDAMEQTRAASSAYSAVLKSAQETLAALNPPPHFESYHELAQREVNLERMVAELMLAAAESEPFDKRMLKTALKAWRRFARESAVEKARKRLLRERLRALEAAGHAEQGRAATTS